MAKYCRIWSSCWFRYPRPSEPLLRKLVDWFPAVDLSRGVCGRLSVADLANNLNRPTGISSERKNCDIYAFLMKKLIRSPWQCPLYLPSPAKGPGTEESRGPSSTCGIQSSYLVWARFHCELSTGSVKVVRHKGELFLLWKVWKTGRSAAATVGCEWGGKPPRIRDPTLLPDKSTSAF